MAPVDELSNASGRPAFEAAHAAHLTGDVDGAEAGYRALLGTEDEVSGTRSLLAAIHRVRGDRAEADRLERSEQAPLGHEAMIRLGRALLAMDDPVAARAIARTLAAEDIEEGARVAEGRVLLARASLALGDRDGAERGLRVALERDPDQGEAVRLLARLLRGDGRGGEGLALLDRSLDRRPEDKALKLERAHARLARGEWTGGWRDMAETGDPAEGRLATGGMEGGFAPGMAPPTPGARVLLRATGAQEETLLLMRFAARLAQTGVTVEMEAPEALLPLLAMARGVSRVGAPGSLGAEGDHDLRLDLRALPAWMGVTSDGPEAEGAYLEVPLDLVVSWGERLEQGLNLGLDWSRASRSRNLGGGLPLEDLAPLLTLPGVNRVALGWWDEAARGAPDPWAARLTFPFAEAMAADPTWAPTLLDTAALLFSMDLVITTDSLVAHLAGALGRPCWVLPPSDAGWYWGTEGETTPWYPTLRLFRQQYPDDWRGPVWAAAAQVGRELVASTRA